MLNIMKNADSSAFLKHATQNGTIAENKLFSNQRQKSKAEIRRTKAVSARDSRSVRGSTFP